MVYLNVMRFVILLGNGVFGGVMLIILKIVFELRYVIVFCNMLGMFVVLNV